jgi:uncharacterized protein (DUF58 family)
MIKCFRFHMSILKRKRPFKLSYAGRSLTFTPLGVRFTLTTLAIGVAAVNSGSNLLYLVVSMMLSMIVLSGSLSENALKNIRAARRLPREVYAAEPFTVRYTLANMKKKSASFALSVCAVYPGDVRGAEGFVPSIDPAGTANADAEETIPRRGELTTEAFDVSTGYPFGFFYKTIRIPARDTALVYPAIRPIEDNLGEELSSQYGDMRSDRKGQGMDVRSLRGYQNTDDARVIHWKASARTAAIVAKEYEAESRRCVLIVLDNLKPADAGWYDDAFEDAVTLAASLVHRLLITEERPVAFAARGIEIPAGEGRGHYVRLMDTLARISPETSGGVEIPRSHAGEQTIFVSPTSGTSGKGTGGGLRAAFFPMA